MYSGIRLMFTPSRGSYTLCILAVVLGVILFGHVLL